jgi:hypothetical protein
MEAVMQIRSPGIAGIAAATSNVLSVATLLMLPALALSGETAVAVKAAQPAQTTAQTSTSQAEIRIEKRTPAYWRVTFDNPPFNIFGPETIPQFEKVVTEIETDPDLKVVVFDSAVPGVLPDPLQSHATAV